MSLDAKQPDHRYAAVGGTHVHGSLLRFQPETILAPMNVTGSSLLGRLRDRKLFQVLLLYLGVAWGLVEVTEFVVGNYDLSRKVLDVTLLLLVLGIPAVGLVTWFHGEKGHQRVQRSEAALLSALVLIAAVGAYRIGTAETAVGRDLTAVVDLGDNSVAVMPFNSRLTDPDLQWLAGGAAELLTTGLAGLQSIRVVSGQRLFDLLRQEGREDATAIPADLATRLTRRAGAKYMVDGSILGSRDDLVMTADLVNVETGDVEASARARGADVFVLVDAIAADLSVQIAGRTISPTEMASVASLTTRDPEAYRQYLLGVQAERRFHRPEAVERYQRAVELDSTFALAHIRLSTAAINNQQISLGLESLQKAQQYRDQAPERDRLLLDAMVAATTTRSTSEARRLLTDLVSRYPDDIEARRLLANSYPARSDERGRLLEELIRLDPLDAGAHNELAYFRARQGDFEAADSLIQSYVELEPNEPNPLDSKGEILGMAGRHAEAREAFRAALTLRPDFSLAIEHLAESWATEGRFEEGAAEVERFIRDSEPADGLGAYPALAILRARQGEMTKALAALESAHELALELDASGPANNAVMAQLPFLVALQDWALVRTRVGTVLRLDPLNPFGPLTYLIALAEQGDLAAAEAEGKVLQDSLTAIPGLADFAPLLEAMLEQELAFYRGDLEESVAAAGRVRELGGTPELGSFSTVRALLGLGRYQAALDAARRTGTFNGPPQALIEQERQYFIARSHEGLADTTAAIAAYERFLNAGWRQAVQEIPLLADAPRRLDALKQQ